MERTNKHTVLKEVRNTGMWAGYAAPSKVNTGNINAIWNLGCPLIITQGRDGEYYVVRSWDVEYEKLDTWLNGYAYYNCGYELGKRISFWVA